ncbi:hypothetical protein JG687_00013224 [Phytophthora cactorum]|uniref:Uncharacterized protein n=1 Tax=Phytophthora cactorum TaxID=29920 RepID=A0A8T1U220_9STRA|nr:hypothetical protein GQ600_4482 [Phytophthora cactorum]KAG6952095.1 hypothetical protein JG687_00013224 [Phytophthora cactorum]
MVIPVDADWITIGIYHDYEAGNKPPMRAGGPVVSIEVGRGDDKGCKMVARGLGGFGPVTSNSPIWAEIDAAMLQYRENHAVGPLKITCVNQFLS